MRRCASWPKSWRARSQTKAKPTKRKPTKYLVSRAPIRDKTASAAHAAVDAVADAAGVATVRKAPVRKTVSSARSPMNSDRRRFRKRPMRLPISTAARLNRRPRWFSPSPLRSLHNIGLRTMRSLNRSRARQRPRLRKPRRRPIGPPPGGARLCAKRSASWPAHKPIRRHPSAKAHPSSPRLRRPSPLPQRRPRPHRAKRAGGHGVSATANKKSK